MASTASNETRLPRAVLRQSAEVQAKIVEREAQRQAMLNPDPEPPSPPASTDTVEPPPPSPPPAPPAASTPPAPGSNWRGTTPPQDDPRYNDPAYWRQRFSVTEGRISAIERERRTEREAMQTQVAALQEEVRTLKAAAPAAPIELSTLFTPEEIATYGEEQCRIVAAKSTEIAKKIVTDELEARMKPLEEARANDVKSREDERRQAFRDQVTALCPEWEEVDKDPRWWAWLDADDASGVPRRELLNAHIRRGNPRGVAGLFQAWINLTSSPPPTPPIVPHGQGASGDAPAPAAPSPMDVQDQRHPTPVEKRDFFKRAALDKVTPEERAKFEARLKLPNPNAYQVRAGAR